MTQTTLSVDDTAAIVAALQTRFPAIAAPHKEDICYATTNRQTAVKAIAARCDALLVLGAPNSSNSKRLVEVASREGCRTSVLVERAGDIDWSISPPVKDWYARVKSRPCFRPLLHDQVAGMAPSAHYADLDF